MRRLSFAALFFAGVLLALVPSARATIVEALDMAELVQASDHAALVEVVALEPRYDDLDRIVTDVTVRVLEPLVGPSRPGDLLVVRRLGGVLGGVGLRIEGEPSFTPGERAVVFLRDVSGVLRPVGMSQGVLPVVVEDGGEVVMPGGAGLSLVRPGSAALEHAAGALAAPTSIDEVLATVRELGAVRR